MAKYSLLQLRPRISELFHVDAELSVALQVYADYNISRQKHAELTKVQIDTRYF